MYKTNHITSCIGPDIGVLSLYRVIVMQKQVLNIVMYWLTYMYIY